MSADGSARDAVSATPLQQHLAALRDLVRLLVPIVMGYCVNVVADRWTLAFVGHRDYQDVTHYDGAGIGKMYSNITGLSLGVSATIGLATFCSQAHGAGCSSEKNPVFVRRAMMLLTGCFTFAFIAAAACEPLLLALGQPSGVARTSARYAHVQLIGVPFFWVANTINVALSSTKRTRPGLTMNVVSSFVQLGAAAVFTDPNVFNLGYLGIALSRSIGGLVSLATIVAYVKLVRLEHLVWQLQPGAERVMDASAFRQYLAVSVPSALVVWSEWWAFEVLSLFVGRTPDAEHNLAAHGTMFNIIVVFYMCWTGTCNALCALVGNCLGAQRNKDIPPLLRVAFIFSLSTSLTVALGYEAFKGILAAAFTEDEQVRQIIRESSIGLVLSVPLYAQLMTFFGALRGANLQKPGILGNVIGYWVIGLPAGGLLGCVFHWPTPLVGVWLGNVIALAVAASWVLSAVFLRIDWQSLRRVSGTASAAPLLATPAPDPGVARRSQTTSELSPMADSSLKQAAEKADGEVRGP